MKNKKPKCRLVGEDGNAFVIIGRVRNTLKKAGQVEKVEKFTEEAMAGDYDHVLQTCLKYVDAY